jgi:hypothetical protein
LQIFRKKDRLLFFQRRGKSYQHNRKYAHGNYFLTLYRFKLCGHDIKPYKSGDALVWFKLNFSELYEYIEGHSDIEYKFETYYSYFGPAMTYVRVTSPKYWVLKYLRKKFKWHLGVTNNLNLEQNDLNRSQPGIIKHNMYPELCKKYFPFEYDLYGEYKDRYKPADTIPITDHLLTQITGTVYYSYRLDDFNYFSKVFRFRTEEEYNNFSLLAKMYV